VAGDRGLYEKVWSDGTVAGDRVVTMGLDVVLECGHKNEQTNTEKGAVGRKDEGGQRGDLEQPLDQTEEHQNP
jgi:hypothetical protein